MRVRVRFDPPGWFAVDVPVGLEVDGEPIYKGSFLAGFTQERELAPGEHELTAVLRTLVARKRSWSFEVPERDEGSVLVVQLGYSRMSGGFQRELSITTVDPGEVESEPPPEEPPPRQRVIATWALLAVLAVVFVAELALGVGPSFELSPSVETLAALGGLAPPSSVEGVWFRAISCMFLHASFLHLLLNAVALFMAGVVVESIVGARWFLALYFVGGLAGSALSLAFNDGTTISVGASGAIMGIFAAGLFLAQTLPSAQRGPVQFQLLRVLVPSLLPIVPQLGGRVDFGAHIGGAIGGALAGFLLLKALRANTDDALLRSPIATGLSGAFVVGSLVALVGVAAFAYPAGSARAAVATALAPDDEIVGQGIPDDATLDRWLADHPDDPRVRMLAAQRAADRNDWEAFDEHVARGQELIPRYAGVFPAPALSALEQEFSDMEAEVAIRRQLVPNQDLPTGSPAEMEATWTRQVDGWVERYPNDPRVRHEAAVRAYEAGDYAAAHVHARRGLEQVPRFVPVFPTGGLDADVAGLTAALALSLLELGRADEAAPFIARICAGQHGDPARAWFTEDGLCAAP